ncbi:MAG: DUF3987 domain-containing protein [Gammaproteobacteria bacterium]
MQEATLRSFFDRSGELARGTGFSCPISSSLAQNRHQGVSTAYRSARIPGPHWPGSINDLLNYSNGMSPLMKMGRSRQPFLPLTAETKAAWIAFHDAIESELRSGGELYDVRDVASKIADNAARIATLFRYSSMTVATLSDWQHLKALLVLLLGTP